MIMIVKNFFGTTAKGEAVDIYTLATHPKPLSIFLPTAQPSTAFMLRTKTAILPMFFRASTRLKDMKNFPIIRA